MLDDRSVDDDCLYQVYGCAEVDFDIGILILGFDFQKRN